MRRAWPLLMAALVSLFLAEGQRAFFASLFELTYDALSPTFRVSAVAVALLPLLAFLAPALPLARWFDRHAAIAMAAFGVAAFRLPMTHPAMEARLIGGALVLVCGAIFLKWAVGYLDRQALGAGVVLGLVIDQLLRLAGTSYDLSLQPGWIPVQALLSLGLIAVVALWTRNPGPARGRNELERRSGGLRLRGGVALGLLLFMELHVLGLPPIIARLTGVEYGAAGLLVGVGSGVAVAGALLLRRPTGGRGATLLLTVLVALAALMGYWLDGMAVGIVMAGGHTAALLLMTRALDPASGRRSGLTASAGFACFALATGLYGVTLHAAPLATLEGGAPWLFGGIGLVLAACFVLLPRPEALTPGPRVPPATLAAGIIGVVVALSIAGRSAAPEAARSPVPQSSAPQGLTADRIRVLSWNASHGFDSDGRFDPGAMGEMLRQANADVMALWDVPAGSPAAYGVDLPLWLGRRAGLDQPARSEVGLGRHALLTRPGGGLFALQLTGDAAADVLALAAALRAVEDRPAVVLGETDRSTTGALGDRLRRAGFRDLSGEPGAHGAGMWVRGLGVDSVNTVGGASGRGAVVATLHILDRPIRSNEANDLQAP